MESNSKFIIVSKKKKYDAIAEDKDDKEFSEFIEKVK